LSRQKLALFDIVLSLSREMVSAVCQVLGSEPPDASATGKLNQVRAFVHAQPDSQGVWEGLLNDLYRRSLRGKHLQLIITDGCPGLAGAIQTVYPRVLQQRCWVHKMRNIREKARKRDRDKLKQMTQAIYLGR
jgi:hypothetical protein